MEEKREPESFMMRVARFIVNKRKAFIALFLLACIYSVLSMSKVKVINDLTDYLPESTETRQGLDIMDEQFTTFGSAKIMVTNITYEKALQLAKAMASAPRFTSSLARSTAFLPGQPPQLVKPTISISSSTWAKAPI